MEANQISVNKEMLASVYGFFWNSGVEAVVLSNYFTIIGRLRFELI